MIPQLGATRQVFIMLISDTVLVKTGATYNKTSACLVFWSLWTESLWRHAFCLVSWVFVSTACHHRCIVLSVCIVCEDALPSFAWICVLFRGHDVVVSSPDRHEVTMSHLFPPTFPISSKTVDLYFFLWCTCNLPHLSSEIPSFTVHKGINRFTSIVF